MSRGILAGAVLGRVAGPVGLVIFLAGLVVFVLLGGLAFFVAVMSDRPGEVGPRSAARVVRVIDGDTVVVRVPGRGEPERVRLLGVDAPEVAHGASSADCWGNQSRALLRRLLPPGTSVGLRGDSTQPSRDVYGRLLRYVETERSGDLGAAMIRQGAAKAGLGDFDVARLDAYEVAESRAADANRGRWRACTLQ